MSQNESSNRRRTAPSKKRRTVDKDDALEVKQPANQSPQVVIKENQDSKPQAPLKSISEKFSQVQDSEWAKSCKVCGTKFSANNGRHHCYQCATVVCGPCSNAKKYLPGQGTKRVCCPCSKRADDIVTQLYQIEIHKNIDGFEASSEEEIIYELEALFDYEPKKTSAPTKRLTFKQGDRISIVFVDSSGWWIGDLKGQRGWVPSTYLEPPMDTC